MVKCIVSFIGAPGSGKGTLSALCVKELGFKQLSTGDLFRKHIKEGTEIGQQIDFAIKSGKLVSDELVSKMVENWLDEEIQKNGEYIILDGYPRTIAQAEYLNKILKEKFSFLKFHVFRLVISDEEVIYRLVNRCVCQNKDCQAIYSTIEGSSLVPKQKGICDKCKSILACRPDDLLEAVQERLKIYHKHEQGLLDFYSQKGFVEEIDVERATSEIFTAFKRLIGILNDSH